MTLTQDSHPSRPLTLLEHDQQYAILLIGVDEVGRGPLCGPVVAGACCFLNPDFQAKMAPLIKDSKALSEPKRQAIFTQLKEAPSQDFVWTCAEASVEEIDTLNILHASLLAMSRALEQLLPKVQHLTPLHILVDGNQRPKLSLGNQHKLDTLVGGDGKSLAIAAASIIAKVTRDEMMHHYDGLYPGYGWANNKGYGSLEHRRALKTHGPTPLHRRSFKPVREAEKQWAHNA